jgi:hypothetical protein
VWRVCFLIRSLSAFNVETRFDKKSHQNQMLRQGPGPLLHTLYAAKYGAKGGSMHEKEG